MINKMRKLKKGISSKKSNSRFDFLNNKRKILKSNRSQEEMVGFSLIIILVAVIALIFLAISIRKPAEIEKSKEIENFLHSSLLHTTSCKPSPEIIYDFKGLVKACYNNEKCLDNKESCEVLNKTASELIENSFRTVEGAKYKAYIFKVYDERNNTLIYLTKGDYTSTKAAGDVIIPLVGENLHIALELSY